jgi:hypothetical protein
MASKSPSALRIAGKKVPKININDMIEKSNNDYLKDWHCVNSANAEFGKLRGLCDVRR